MTKETPDTSYKPSFSPIAWGMGSLPMSFTVRQVEEMLDACEETGITTIDNAENYGGHTREKLLGDALALKPSLRNKLQLVTKCGCVNPSPVYPEYYMYHYDTRKSHIMEAAEKSLNHFRTDRLEGLLLHRSDPLMDADEVAEAFVALHQAGKVLAFGVSNFTPGQFNLLASRLPFPLSIHEFQLSVIHTMPLFDGTLDLCQQQRVIPMAWGPLGRGALFTEDSVRISRVRDVLTCIGDELGGATMDQVALVWLLEHPAKVIPVLGSIDPSQIKQSAAASKWRLTRQQWFRILEASQGSLP